MPTNPFEYGNPVSPANFIIPNQEIMDAIVKRLTSGGNTAIVSEPRFGKTSLLQYLKSKAITGSVNPPAASNSWRRIFHYIDIHLVFGDKTTTQEQFWKYALSPIKSFVRKYPDSEIAREYQCCIDEQFSIFALENFFDSLVLYKVRLVLLIDEFDDLLSHPELGKEGFFGGLRSLSTLKESLELVIATRLSVSELNQQEQFLHNHSGSPYFNHFHQEFLGPFSPQAAQKLLERGADRFSKADRAFLEAITGRHPYFMQVAAYALWEIHENPLAESRVEYVARQLYLAAEPALQDTWQHWPAPVRKALIVVALDEMPRLFNKRGYDSSALSQSLERYPSELRRLEQGGFIAKTPASACGWCVPAQVVLWWLSNVLLSALREDDDLGQFLKEQGMSKLFTASEKAQFSKAVGFLGGLAKLGMESFVKSAAEGFVKGMNFP
jgi:hypothetical protein